MFKYPVFVKDIIECVPHRYPAVWIDEVLSSRVCRVSTKEAPYMENGFVRQSSFIEFMAQAYAYVVACETLTRETEFFTYKKAFLVSLKDIKFASGEKIGAGESLLVDVEKVHEVGPMLVIDGKVMRERDHFTLAEGQFKVFVE